MRDAGCQIYENWKNFRADIHDRNSGMGSRETPN
jgi:hypothetical protein